MTKPLPEKILCKNCHEPFQGYGFTKVCSDGCLNELDRKSFIAAGNNPDDWRPVTYD